MYTGTRFLRTCLEIVSFVLELSCLKKNSGIVQPFYCTFPQKFRKCSGTNPQCSGNVPGFFEMLPEISGNCPGTFQSIFGNVLESERNFSSQNKSRFCLLLLLLFSFRIVWKFVCFVETGIENFKEIRTIFARSGEKKDFINRITQSYEKKKI